MNQVETLTKQTENAYEWVNKLIDPIPYNKWDITPNIIESNVSWQVGHLIISFYYHSIMTIVGHQPDVLEKIPLKEYSQLYKYNSLPKNAVEKSSPETLQKHIVFLQEKSIDIIKSLSQNDLESKLEPTQVPHPIAKNKFEALDWNIKHTMWHCGQLGILKRVVNERFDFGL